VVCQERDPLSLSVYPNPIATQLTVTFSRAATSKLLLNIVDMNGKTVLVNRYESPFNKGGQSLELDVSALKPGQYVLFLTTNYGREAVQIVKL